MTENKLSLGEAIKNIFAKLLLGFLIISFAVWGIGDMTGGSNSQHIASVGDSIITAQEFRREWDMYRTQLRGQLPEELTISAMFQKQVLKRLIDARLLREAARSAGILISEDLVARHIRRDPQYQDIHGNFDTDMFARILEISRMTEAGFKDMVSENITLDMAYGALGMHQVTPSESWKQLARISAQEIRGVDVVTLHIDKKETFPTPPESVLKAAYERNLERFMLPESRNVALATIAPNEIERLAEQQLDNEKVSQYMRDNGIEDNATNRKMAKKALPAASIDDTVYELAIAIEDALAAGATLKEAIETAAINARFISLDQVTQDALNSKWKQYREYLQNAFQSDVGDTTNLQTTPSGEYFVLQVTAINPSEPRSFEDVKSEVEKTVIADERQRRMRQHAEELRVKLLGAVGVDARNAVLKDYKLSRNVTLLRRNDDANENVHPALRAAAFVAQHGAVLGPFQSPEETSIQIGILTSIHIPSPDQVKPDSVADDATVERFREQVEATMHYDLQHVYPVDIAIDFTDQGNQ